MRRFLLATGLSILLASCAADPLATDPEILSGNWIGTAEQTSPVVGESTAGTANIDLQVSRTPSVSGANSYPIDGSFRFDSANTPGSSRFFQISGSGYKGSDKPHDWKANVTDIKTHEIVGVMSGVWNGGKQIGTLDLNYDGNRIVYSFSLKYFYVNFY